MKTAQSYNCICDCIQNPSQITERSDTDGLILTIHRRSQTAANKRRSL